MILSKKPINFSGLFAPFLKSTLIFEYFQKMFILIAYILPKLGSLNDVLS